MFLTVTVWNANLIKYFYTFFLKEKDVLLHKFKKYAIFSLNEYI